MDDAPVLPHVFANRVIRQFADHLLGTDVIIEPRDYIVMRLVFRKCGGRWLDVVQGDIRQVTLLEKVLTNWGKGSNVKRDSEDYV